jgi:hypothetical protein
MTKINLLEAGKLLNNASEDIFSTKETVWFNKEVLSNKHYEELSLYDCFINKSARELLIKDLLKTKSFDELSKKEFNVLKLKLRNNKIQFKETEDYFLFDKKNGKIIIYKHDKLYIPYYVKNNIDLLYNNEEKKHYTNLIDNIDKF